MKVSEYEKADCTLFRLPPIDVSYATSIIEKILVKTWENGQSVDNAIEGVLSNRTVVDKLTEQISTNLKFQKQTIIKQSEAEAQAKISEYEAAKQEKLTSLQENYSKEKEDEQRKLEEKQKELEERQQSYSASQARLDEMRARVEAKMKRLGGKKGLKKLMTINEIIEEEKEKTKPAEETKTEEKSSYGVTVVKRRKKRERPKHVPYKPPEEKTPEPATASPKETKVSPLEKVVEEEPEEEPKKRGKPYRFFKKIWEVLNYEVW
jgi:hypothetical protein